MARRPVGAAAVLLSLVVLFLAEVIRDLSFEGELQHPLRQLQQPALAGW